MPEQPRVPRALTAQGAMPLLGELLPFAAGQVCTMHLPVEIREITDDGTIRCRVLRPWGGYMYWDCSTEELFAVTKP